MTRFTIRDKKKWLLTAVAVTFWVIAWQLYSDMLGQEILMVSPVSVAKTLLGLMGQRLFWRAVFSSCGRILTGFGLAVICGVALAALGHFALVVRVLLAPVMLAMKSVPVASFVLLLLFYVPSKNLATPVSFVMVLPVIYVNVLQGIEETDRQILEMAQVFRLSPLRRVIYIYTPQVLPFFVSAATVSLGLAWKSGIAAEVIGMPAGSIGERLYRAKAYLQTGELLAWTLVVVLISLIFEHLFIALLGRATRPLGER